MISAIKLALLILILVTGVAACISLSSLPPETSLEADWQDLSIEPTPERTWSSQFNKWACESSWAWRFCVLGLELVPTGKFNIEIEKGAASIDSVISVFFREFDGRFASNPYHARKDDDQNFGSNERLYRSRYQKSDVANTILFEDVAYLIAIEVKPTNGNAHTQSYELAIRPKLMVEVSAANIADKYHTPDRVTLEQYKTALRNLISIAISDAKSKMPENISIAEEYR